MDDIEWLRRARKYRRFRTFGTFSPSCVSCGENDWRVRYERHHIAGRRFDPDATVLVCINCHDKLSDRQKDHQSLGHLERSRAVVTRSVQGLIDLLCIQLDTLRKVEDVLSDRRDEEPS